MENQPEGTEMTTVLVVQIVPHKIPHEISATATT